MSLKEMVLYTTMKSETFFLNKEGVWNINTTQIKVKQFPPFNEQYWSLVDCPEAPNEHIPSNITYGTSQLFFVATLSPDTSRYKRAITDHVRMWWMSPWTDEELLMLCVIP